MVKITCSFVLLLLSCVIYSHALPIVPQGEAAKSDHGASLEKTNEDSLNKISIRKDGQVSTFTGDVSNFIQCRSRGNDKAREKFTKGLCQTYNDKHNRKMNIMVFNTEQPYEQNLHNVNEEVIEDICGLPYRVWAFESGEFNNKGDGGFINWCFLGRFDRDGGRVKFFKR